MKKAHSIVNRSWQLGKLAHVENFVSMWLRNNLIKLTSGFTSRKQMGMIFNLTYLWALR